MAAGTDDDFRIGLCGGEIEGNEALAEQGHDLFLEHVATVSDFLTVVFSHTCNSPIAITADTVHFRVCNRGRDHGQKITDRGYGLFSHV